MRTVLSFLAIGLVALSSAKEGLAGFDATLTLDANIVQSDKNQTTFRALLEGAKKRDVDSLKALFKYFYSEQRVGSVRGITADNWLLNGLYERVMNEKTDWFLDASLERDAVIDLDLRKVFLAGLTYKVLNQENSTFKVRGGLGYISENYASSPDTDSFSLGFGTEYWRKVNEKWSVTHNTRLIPAFDDFSDYFFQSDLGLNYQFEEGVSGSIRYLLDYDATPATGLRKDRQEWLIGIKFHF